MKTVSYLERLSDLEHCRAESVQELILAPRLLSRFGELTAQECYLLAERCRASGIRPLLEWDILMTEDVLDGLREALAKWNWSAFDAIRVQDAGAFNYLLENVPGVALQPILETGNHNLAAVAQWVALAGDRLDRVVLSPQTTEEDLERTVCRLEVPLEILGIGRILLYYSPRRLLAASGCSEARADSLEGPQRNLPVLQNSHGTFLFHGRDRFLLAAAPRLRSLGLAALRIDLRFGRDFALLPRIARAAATGSGSVEIAAAWPAPLTWGFFKVNRTDAPFRNLKNRRLPPRDENYLGEIVESVKGNYLAFVLAGKRCLRGGEQLKFCTPDGRIKRLRIAAYRNSSFEELPLAEPGGLLLIPAIGGVPVKSAVYLDESCGKASP